MPRSEAYGYGLGWVSVPGRAFVKEGIHPGDWLTVERGRETTRYPIPRQRNAWTRRHMSLPRGYRRERIVVL